jgi:hypothetical protein
MDDTNPFSLDRGVEQDFPAADEPAIEAPPAIGTDERRMHVRAYNYWVSLLEGRSYPSIDDLDPDLPDFGPNSVLLDFTNGPDNASIPYLGKALREEGGLTGDIRAIADVPPRSVLSRLTDHYLEILANRAPIGFEAEYVSHRGLPTMYRGILMPFTSNGDEIDFIYGVINWKDVVEVDVGDDVRRAVEHALSEPARPASPAPLWADGPQLPQEHHDLGRFGTPGLEPIVFETEDIIPSASALYDRLAIAREAADAMTFADQRSRAALYAALGQAHDFALAAEDEAQTYATILEDAGLKAQARAPMTPLVKLIFGAAHDKTRLAEYAAVLSHARRLAVPAGALPAFLENFAGGLKAVVQAERALRRPTAVPEREAAVRAALNNTPALASVTLPPIEADYVSLVARRECDGSFSIVTVSEAAKTELARAARLLKH